MLFQLPTPPPNILAYYMAFYVGHGLQHEIESDASSDFAEPDLDDDSEWEDPQGAFNRDTREPIKQPEGDVKPPVPLLTKVVPHQPVPLLHSLLLSL